MIARRVLQVSIMMSLVQHVNNVVIQSPQDGAQKVLQHALIAHQIQHVLQHHHLHNTTIKYFAIKISIIIALEQDV